MRGVRTHADELALRWYSSPECHQLPFICMPLPLPDMVAPAAEDVVKEPGHTQFDTPSWITRYATAPKDQLPILSTLSVSRPKWAPKMPSRMKDIVADALPFEPLLISSAVFRSLPVALMFAMFGGLGAWNVVPRVSFAWLRVTKAPLAQLSRAMFPKSVASTVSLVLPEAPA